MKNKKTEAKLIAEFGKNASEVIRIQFVEYKSQKLLDIRAWVVREGAEAIPTKKGLTLRLEQIDDLQDAIMKAAAEEGKS